MEVGQYETLSDKTEMPGTEAIVLTETGMQIAAFWSRFLCGYGLADRFDPLVVLERLHLFDRTFNYEVCETETWHWGASVEAFYSPQENKIFIRGDVYEKACHRNLLAVLTIAHEICHYIQFFIKNFLAEIGCVAFTTELCTEGSAELSHHETQTDAIMAFVLCPERFTEGKTQEEILQNYVIKPLIQFICGVIKEAAKQFLQSLDEIKIGEKEVEVCAV
ncbi:MAG: hypothetical protein K2I95_06175 [Treponemataceae bacterium]|nr:hypothetical protein [Treponemataceae bacterium]